MTDEPNQFSNEPTSETPLEGWKDIATYLKRGVRTVKRWEKSEGLPVRRHQHQARASVYAYPSELDAWLATRQPAAEQPGLLFRRPVSALATAAALLLALASVASGPLTNPPGVAAREPAKVSGVVVRQVWGNGDATGAPSPDGRYLSYVNWYTGDLAVRNVETGETRNVTDEGTWAGPDRFAYYSVWSPDSRQLAYAWFNEDHFELRTVGLNGGEPRVLYQNEEVIWIRAHDWSEDGQYILALLRRKERTNQIALVSVKDGSVRVVKTLDWRYPLIMSLSPDGRTIAYDLIPEKDATISAARDLYLLASDGSNESVLVHHPANDYGPVWTPDGDRIIFTSDRAGTTGAWMIEVENRKRKGVPRLVNASLGRMFPMGFTQDRALYFGYANFENGGNIYVATLDAQTGEVVEGPERAIQRFEGENTSPAWSPDGNYLAYLSRRGSSPFGAGSWTIRIRNLETGEERELLPQLDSLHNDRASPPQWSSDGRFLVVQGVALKGRTGLFRVDVETGDAELVFEAPRGQIRLPQWSGDGKTLYYYTSRVEEGEAGSFVLARELKTGEERVLYRGHMDNLALSPSGEKLAFVAQGDKKGTHSIKLLPVEGGTPRDVVANLPADKFPNLSDLTWAADGRHLIYTTRVGEPPPPQWPVKRVMEIWRVPLQGGKPQRLGIQMEDLRDLAVHRDGRRLAFTAGNPAHAEVWVLENFLPGAEVARAE